MPIYEFQCRKCGVVREQRLNEIPRDASVVLQAKCGCGEWADRIPSRTAPPKFRGTGFYETDYKVKSD